MASKFVNIFQDFSYALPQIQLLFMDSQSPGGQAMSLNFAVAFAEKYLTNLKDQVPPTYFSNLWLKLLISKRDFVRAL